MGDWFTDAFPLNLNQEEKEKKQNVIDSIDVANCIDVARPLDRKQRKIEEEDIGQTRTTATGRIISVTRRFHVVETREEAV